MELEYTDKVAIIYETLKNIETAILRIQERTKEVKTVDEFFSTPPQQGEVRRGTPNFLKP